MTNEYALSIIYSSFCALSLLLSLSIVISGLIFPSVLINFKRPFSYAIFFTSLSDFLGSIGGTFGYQTGGWKCTLQSVLSQYFPPASWIWAAMLVFQLRSLLIDKKLGLKEYEMHMIGWGIPLLPLLLPLSSEDMAYGQDDIVANLTPCSWTSDHEISKYIWILSLYWFLALTAFVLMARWLYLVHKYFKAEGVPSNSIEYSLFRTMSLYPMSMMITWIPIGLFIIIGLPLSAHTVVIAPQQLVLLLSTQNGTLMSLIFFFRSKRIRYHWRHLICEFQLPTKQGDHNSRRLSADGVVAPTFKPRELSLISEDGEDNDLNFDYSGFGEDSDEELLLICNKRDTISRRHNSTARTSNFTRRLSNDNNRRASTDNNRSLDNTNDLDNGKRSINDTTRSKTSVHNNKLLTENPIFKRPSSSLTDELL